MKKNSLHQSGFTLVEIMIVIIIIGIIASVAVPSFSRSLSQQATQKGATEIINVFNQARANATLNNKDLNIVIANNKDYLIRSTGTNVTTIGDYKLEDRLEVKSNVSSAIVVSSTGRISGAGGVLVFRVCDSKYSGETGYTVWINSFGISRYTAGKIKGIGNDTISNVDC